MIDNFLKKHNKRIIGLDVLRVIAIALVIYEHGGSLLPKYFHKEYYKYMPAIDGVSVFFILSGFLIGGILLKIADKEKFTKKNLLNFWIRRWFRTIPAYFLVLIAVLSCRLVLFKNTGAFSIKYLFFLQNFMSPHPHFFPEAWSLSIEEWFYLKVKPFFNT